MLSKGKEHRFAGKKSCNVSLNSQTFSALSPPPSRAFLSALVFLLRLTPRLRHTLYASIWEARFLVRVTFCACFCLSCALSVAFLLHSWHLAWKCSLVAHLFSHTDPITDAPECQLQSCEHTLLNVWRSLSLISFLREDKTMTVKEGCKKECRNGMLRYKFHSISFCFSPFFFSG